MSINLELKAMEALRKLRDEAQAVKETFIRAGMSLPPSLAALLGESPGGQQVTRRPKFSLSAPQGPSPPPGAEDDWIWIPLDELTATPLALALLRANGPMSAKSLAEDVVKRLPGTNDGSVFNIVARHDGKRLNRTEDGFELADPKDAPVIHGANAWGPISVFTRHELASHRRSIIMHLLSAVPAGLQEMQIVSHLKDLPYCQSTVNKSLVKADMQLLKEAGKVKRVGNTKKWTATKSRADQQHGGLL
jgi:hypothetical protein